MTHEPEKHKIFKTVNIQNNLTVFYLTLIIGLCVIYSDPHYTSGLFQNFIKVLKNVFLYCGTNGGTTEVYDAWV